MQTRHQLALAVGGLCALASLIQAQPSAHYPAGIEGIKGASLPPPGLYLRDYNMLYTSGRLNGPTGSEVGAADLSALTYVNAPRLVYITDTKFLGGNVGVDGLLPLTYNGLRANTPSGPYDDGMFGIGDFFAEGTLSWHLTQFDFSAGAGLWMPTGDSPLVAYQPTVRAGQGYWTPMLTAGATWFIDTAKTWSVSALNRYEINTEQRDTEITPGQAYTLEWGVAKTLHKFYDIGVVGYYQQQVTHNTGGTIPQDRNRVAAVGPEISVACPKHMVFASLRYNYEFMAESRAQGQTWCLTITKRF
jgi:hypothetical protein